MCELVKVTDNEGTTMVLKQYLGRYYPSIFIGNVKDHLEAIENMEVRDDDTFILSYPKSGTHWISSIAKMLQTGNTSYIGSPDFLDFNTMDTLNSLSSPRVFASHMTFEFLPRQVKEGKGKVIVIFRNPKDVAVSLYQFFKSLVKISDFTGCWNGFLNLYINGRMLYGSWFESLSDWEKTQKVYDGKNILCLKYEDLKQDLQTNVAKVSSFLGESHDEKFLEEVTKRCTFKNMERSAEDESKPQEQWETVSETKKLPIYRKGEVGDWKNHFTVLQNENFDKVYDDKMADSSFTFRFV